MTNHNLISEEEHRHYLDSLRNNKEQKVFVALNQNTSLNSLSPPFCHKTNSIKSQLVFLLAFAQGPGQAAAFGALYEGYGWENAAVVGVAFAAVGFLVSFLMCCPLKIQDAVYS